MRRSGKVVVLASLIGGAWLVVAGAAMPASGWNAVDHHEVPPLVDVRGSL